MVKVKIYQDFIILIIEVLDNGRGLIILWSWVRIPPGPNLIKESI